MTDLPIFSPGPRHLVQRSSGPRVTEAAAQSEEARMS